MASTQLKLLQLIPDGVYRIKTGVHPNEYMEFVDTTHYDVRPAPSDPSSDKQKWIIKGNTPTANVNTYSITNVASKLHLSFREDKNREGAKIFRLSAFDQGSQWTIEPRGEQFVIGWEGNQQCVDYANSGTEMWLILWDRNNQLQQRWILEPAAPGEVVAAEAAKVKVRNLTDVDIEVFITTYNKIGNAGWFPIAAGSWDSWHREASEGMVARIKGSTEGTPGTTIGAWVPAASVASIISFNQAVQIHT